MTLIVLGVILWSGVHLIPALAPGLKRRWQSALGNGGYKGSFSLLILAALGLMIIGWRSALPVYLYTLSETIQLLTIAMMVFASVLFVAAKLPTRLKHLIRHPQLAAVALWSGGHLLANGDSRSLVLFGGLLIWSLVEMFAINRRQEAWVKPPVKGVWIEFLTLILGGVLFTALLLAHPYLSGIKLG
ncbi:MAG: NnrU family protein [Pseudomonadota bacterium]|nr:NnrU family protein [Pseudomonadota bacterium]